MSETVLDVLMYLFENFSEQEPEALGLIRSFCGKSCFRPDLVSSRSTGLLDWLEELTAGGGQPFTNPPDFPILPAVQWPGTGSSGRRVQGLCHVPGADRHSVAGPSGTGTGPAHGA